jgi:hypothetical protein
LRRTKLTFENKLYRQTPNRNATIYKEHSCIMALRAWMVGKAGEEAVIVPDLT